MGTTVLCVLIRHKVDGVVEELFSLGNLMPDASRVLPPDIEIARRAPIRPIEAIAERLGIPADDLEHYGKYKAKVSLDLYRRLQDRPTGKLVLVTAITPTPAGEGKTTTSIGLCDGLNRIGKPASV